eukprot:9504150-Pyramimonas_sp.AAC.1
MVVQARKRVRERGFDPARVVACVDDSSSNMNCMIELAPCLTASRGSTGGHWLLKHGRRMSQAELFRIQGMSPSDIDTSGLSDAQIGRAIGNAMTQTVVESIFDAS